MRRWIGIIGKGVGWLIVIAVALLFAVVLLLQIPAVQTRLAREAATFLEDKIGTPVAVEALTIGFPKNVVVKGFYIEDPQGDTLVYLGRLAVDADLPALLQQEVAINHVTLEGLVANIARSRDDSTFNFQYIADAFSDTTAVEDTQPTAWVISLNSVLLKNIRLQLRDLYGGTVADLVLGTLTLDMETFDLENGVYLAESIAISESRLRAEQAESVAPEATSEETDTTGMMPDVGFRSLHIRDTRIAHRSSAQDFRLSVGDLHVEAQTIDLRNQVIDLEEVDLRDTKTSLYVEASDTAVATPTPSVEESVAPAPRPWTINVNTIGFENASVQYDDAGQPAAEEGLDFSHLAVSDINFDIRQVRYDSTRMSADLRAFRFRETSGFEVASLTGRIDVRDQQATLGDLSLRTGNSTLQADLTVQYPSLATIADTYNRTAVQGQISSQIGPADLFLFQPSLRDSLPVDLVAAGPIALSAQVDGHFSDLRIRQLSVDALNDTRLRAAGSIRGLPAPAELTADIRLAALHTTRADLQRVLPDTLLPDSIGIPDWINLEGRYRGSLQRSTVSAELTSSVGSISTRADVNLDSAAATPGITGWLRANKFDLGYILGQPDSVLRTVSISLDGKVHGHTTETMDGTLDVKIEDFFFRGYDYSDLDLTGTLQEQVVRMEATMEDANLAFSLHGGYDFSGEVPAYSLLLDVTNAHLQPLHLSQEPIRLRGQLQADVATDDFRVLNGNVGLRKVAIFNGDDLYSIDSLLFASIDQEGQSSINIDSDLLTAQFEGSFNLFRMPDVIRQYVHTYYQLHDTLGVDELPRQHFNFFVRFNNTDVLTDLLVPDLTALVPGEIRGSFDSEARELDLHLELHHAVYGNISLDSLRIQTDSDRKALNFQMNIDQILIDSMRIDGLELLATAAQDSMETTLTILDSANQDKYHIAGTFVSTESGFDLMLAPDAMLLNYQRWAISEDNLLRFGAGSFMAKDVTLSHDNEQILLRADADQSAPVVIGFRNLTLQHFGNITAENDLIAGVLNGDIALHREGGEGKAFTADIGVQDLGIRGATWGDLTLSVAQNTTERFTVDFLLSGAGSDIAINGFYQAGEAVSMNLTADVRRFALATLQPLLASQVSDLQGDFAGDIRITGTPQQPDLDGSLRFSDASFSSIVLNTGFSLKDEAIRFMEEGLAFNNFEITDENGNVARLDGTIRTADYRDFRFHLDLNVEDFRLLNTKQGDHPLFYGNVGLDARARIRGNTSTPVVDVDVGLTPGSHLTYVVPQAEAAVLQTEGIVTFVDKTFEEDPFMANARAEAGDTVKTAFTGIDLTARLALTGEENITVVIDPLTGDQLSLRGNADLILSMDPTGDMNLTGRYEIEEGSYSFTFYKFVKREFQIDEGSSITWLGDPLNAQMDIRAIYRVETSPIDLLANQLTGVDPERANAYRRRMPFLVYLNLEGELLNPDISFRLDMPPDERNAFNGMVYTRLQDVNSRESDLNKQVFALLILKRFISDNPLESEAGGGLASTARRSVSKVLTDQLNRLSDNIKGIELSFDIKSYEDYAGGSAEAQTELELGVSKSFLNERLVVKLSGNVGIEGENSRRSATDYIGDLALEYKITPDGRLRITGFRNSNYDMIDGELIETGAGVIYIKDYNTLSELFKRNASTEN